MVMVGSEIGPPTCWCGKINGGGNPVRGESHGGGEVLTFLSR